jgi:hypothetical protein
MPTVRRGKQRYVAGADFAIWLLSYRARQEAQAELLEALEGEDLISKQEAMALAGLGETHLTRYLKSGVIRAWKAPTMGRRGRGYWLVERRSVEAFLAARAEGRLAQYLDRFPDYVALRRRLGAEVAALRRAGRLAQPDPLTEPKSRFHAGCFTVAQVAGHAGLSAQVVYEAISRGRLKAERVISGGRPRYGLLPVEAHRYVAGLKSEEGDGYYHNRCRRQIAEAGLLTARDLAERWRRPIETIYAYGRSGYRGQTLPSRCWGRYRVFDPVDVEAFERAANLQQAGTG